ncbi:MAG: transglutaminase TgpA family protein [Actinomycetota bacterium]
MSAGILARAQARVKGAPEDAVALRVVVAAMVEWAILAVIAQGAVDPVTAVVALALAPAGYLLSYVRRHRPSNALKAILAGALLLALGTFLQGVRGAMSFEDVRAPLAALFLWVQVLHAFDVPRRRDLGFSAVSSLILIAQAGSMSFGTGFLFFLVPWLALASAWMLLTLRPPAAELATVVALRRVGGRGHRALGGVGSLVVPLLAVLLAIAAVFLTLPRLPGASVALPPFSTARTSPVEGFDGGVDNPGLVRGPDGVADYSSFAYPGFGDSLDLRGRGRLSDEIVFRARAPQALLWRGQVFDTYDGTTWTATEEPPYAVVQDFDDVFRIPPMPGDVEVGPHRRVLATVFVARRQPNVVFAPYRATEVYFPTSSLRLDRSGAIASPVYLEEGMVYSVVSQVPVTSPGLLRLSPARWTRGALERYTQLPAELPQRVRDLAEEIAGDEPTVYDQAHAIEEWLRANTEYELDIPPDPPGVDAVDHFLFERRRGFCEHIASAMVVLLRSVGVPARIVTGFRPGARNPFSGSWDVRGSDAHAWVEVLYTGVGWVPYDPTFGVPPADPGLSGRFIAPEVLRAIGAFLADVIPEPVKAAASAIGRGVVGVTRAAVAAWPVVPALAIAVVGALAVLRRRVRRRALGPPPTGAALAFAGLEDAMRARGHPRRDPQTPSEYLRALPLHPGERSDAELIVRTFERERFSAQVPSVAEIEAALAAARGLREPTPSR